MDTKINRILFPVDFTKRCEQAASQIEAWAKHFSATVVVVNVINPRDLYSDPARQEGTFMEELPNLRVRAEADLQYFSDRYLAQCSHQTLVLDGDTADSIVTLAGEESANIVMFPRNHQSLGSRWLHDSVSARVLESCPVPVWTTEHPETLSNALPNKILCAVHVRGDIRQDAENDRMLAIAKLVSIEFAASLTILYVGTPEEDNDREGVDGDAIQEIPARLSTIRRETQDVANFERATGDIKVAIVDASSRLSVDLILLGRSGLGTVGLGLQGRVLSVNHSVKCPMISI